MLCEFFQKHLEKENCTKTFLQKRPSANAHMDFIGREYDPVTNETLREIVMEVRTLNYTENEINQDFD